MVATYSSFPIGPNIAQGVLLNYPLNTCDTTIKICLKGYFTVYETHSWKVHFLEIEARFFFFNWSTREKKQFCYHFIDKLYEDER